MIKILSLNEHDTKTWIPNMCFVIELSSENVFVIV